MHTCTHAHTPLHATPRASRSMPDMPESRGALARIVPKYTHIFLYNIDDKTLYGCFEGTAKGACGCAGQGARWGGGGRG